MREASILADVSVVKDVVLLRAGPGNLGDFEGAQAYLSHPSAIEEQTRPERSVKDLAGWYSDVTCREYTDPKLGKTVALYADFHAAVGKDEVLTILRTCVEYAKRYYVNTIGRLSMAPVAFSKASTCRMGLVRYAMVFSCESDLPMYSSKVSITKPSVALSGSHSS